LLKGSSRRSVQRQISTSGQWTRVLDNDVSPMTNTLQVLLLALLTTQIPSLTQSPLLQKTVKDNLTRSIGKQEVVVPPALT